MEDPEATSAPVGVKNEGKVQKYAVWALPDDGASRRLKKIMEGLREEFGGPVIEPHIPVVGSIHSTHEDVLETFAKATGGTTCFNCRVGRVCTSLFYYQCLHLWIDPTDEVMRTMFGPSSVFIRLGNMPHLCLFYGGLSEEEKEKAKEKVMVLDDGIVGFTFTIKRMALYKCNQDMTQQSWEKIAETILKPKPI